MVMDDIKRELQEWIFVEERAGRKVDMNRLNERLQIMMQRHNSAPRNDFNGLSPEQMRYIMYEPFSEKCVVTLNKLSKEKYEQIPLLRQAIFLLQTLSETELKLTKLGWLPLKFVSESYKLGSPDYFIDNYKSKRINEYDAMSVWMSRITLDLLGWIKTRKGMLSLTAKGKKAMMNMDAAANEILLFMLTGVELHSFDGHEDDRIGNLGMAYSVWLLNKYGNDWHTGEFYQEHYQKVINIPEKYNIYATRVFQRLFYWLGIDEERLNRQVGPPFQHEYKKTELLSIMFSFKNK